MGSIINHPRTDILNEIDRYLSKRISPPYGQATSWPLEIQKLPQPFREVIISDFQYMRWGLMSPETFAANVKRIDGFIRSQINAHCHEMPDLTTKYSPFADLTKAHVVALKSTDHPPQNLVDRCREMMLP